MSIKYIHIHIYEYVINTCISYICLYISNITIRLYTLISYIHHHAYNIFFSKKTQKYNVSAHACHRNLVIVLKIMHGNNEV